MKEAGGSRGSYWTNCMSKPSCQGIHIHACVCPGGSVPEARMSLQVLSLSVRVPWFLPVWICMAFCIYMHICIWYMYVCICITGTTCSASPTFPLNLVGLEAQSSGSLVTVTLQDSATTNRNVGVKQLFKSSEIKAMTVRPHFQA